MLVSPDLAPTEDRIGVFMRTNIKRGQHRDMLQCMHGGEYYIDQNWGSGSAIGNL